MPLIAAILIAASASAVNGAATVTQPSERVWKAGSWGDAVQKLPCEAFRRADDGAWVMPGKIELPGSNVISNMTVTDPADAAVLNKRCGARSSDQ